MNDTLYYIDMFYDNMLNVLLNDVSDEALQTSLIDSLKSEKQTIVETVLASQSK